MYQKSKKRIIALLSIALVAVLGFTSQTPRVSAQGEPVATIEPTLIVEDWVGNAVDENVYASVAPDDAEGAGLNARQLYLPVIQTGVADDANASRQVNAAAGSTWLVTKVADTNDHVCNTDCSLREAAEAAAATAAVDTISLPAGVYKLTLGPIALGTTQVLGAGASKSIIDGQQRSGVITILGGEVTLQKVTIRNGKGPGIYHDIGNLTLADSVVTANKAADTCGGGIRSVFDNAKQLTIRNTQITNNRAGDGGGICLSTVAATILNSTIDGNQATGRGGGIYANEAGFNMTDSTLSNNRAGTSGGGFYTRLGVSTMASSAVLKNQANDGGGIWSNESGLQIRNTTISGNSATNNGGGVDNEMASDLTLEHVTLAFNVADSDQKNGGDGGGLLNAQNPNGNVILRHTLIGKNTDKSGQANDCAGTLTSDTYNLLQQVGGCVLTGNLQGNITGVDPQLGPLDLHGGLTQNHLPASNSAATDAIPVASCTLTVDQRGIVRPQDGNNDGSARCDIGAIERKPSGQ